MRKQRFKKLMRDLPKAPQLINSVGIQTQVCLAPKPSTPEIFFNLLVSVPWKKKKEDTQNLKNLNPKLKENKYFKELSPAESKNSPMGSVQSKTSLSKQMQEAGFPTLCSPYSEVASYPVRRAICSGDHRLLSPTDHPQTSPSLGHEHSYVQSYLGRWMMY